MDELCSLLEILLNDNKLADRIFCYALEHSTNAFKHKKGNVGDAHAHKNVVFDWIVSVAHAFDAMPTGTVKLTDNGELWISKDVVFSLNIMNEVRADLVEKVKEAFEKKPKRLVPNTPVGILISELDFSTAFLYFILHRKIFAMHELFSSRKCFVRHMLSHARKINKPLKKLELVYESVFFSWSMRFNKDGGCSEPPWNQTWREYAGRFASVQKEMVDLEACTLTFRGQRHLAFDFFDRTENLQTVLQNFGIVKNTSQAFFRGMWILGAGRNSNVRIILTGQREEWKVRQPPLWASFVIPWVDPSLFDSEMPLVSANKKRKLENIENISHFMVVAAMLDQLPEANDCEMHAWVHMSSFRSDFLQTRPHLSHALYKLERYMAHFTPPAWMCENIHAHAQKFLLENSAKGRYWEPSEIIATCKIIDYDKNTIAHKLVTECCFQDAQDLENFHKKYESDVVRVFAFTEQANISWLDVKFSRDKIWPKMGIKATEMLAVRTSREFFIIGTSDALNMLQAPVLYAHPFSLLRTKEYQANSMWSARLDLLEMCI